MLGKQFHLDAARRLVSHDHVKVDGRIVLRARHLLQRELRARRGRAPTKQEAVHKEDADGNHHQRRIVEAVENAKQAGARLLDLNQLELKIQDRIGRDAAAGAAAAISQLRRYRQFPLVALLHQRQRLGPALDDLVGRKGRRLATLHRRIEDRAVNQRARVMAEARRRQLGRLAALRARLDDLVLEAARQRDYVGVLGILLEVREAGLVGCEGHHGDEAEE